MQMKEVFIMDDKMISAQAQEVIEKLRPYINRDGGDIKFVKYEDGIVYVQMLGACVGCAAIDTTLTDGVEAILLEEVPGIIGVEQI
ncbi:MAG: NifU family protein [Bacillota bacterium]